jgi:Major Facilitator Superfamily.
MTMMMPVIPMYIEKLGAAKSLSGVVVGVFTFTALFCRPFWGKLIDTWSRKIVTIAGCIFAAAACFSYHLAESVALLLLIRIIHGIGFSAVTNATATMAADMVPAERRSEGLGYYGAAFAASLALGPALSMKIYNSLSMSAVFTIAGIIMLAGLLFAAFTGRVKESAGYGNKNAKQSVIEITALPDSVLMAIIAFNYVAVMTFVPSYAISLGLGSMSSFFLIYSAALILCRTFVGKFTDKHGMNVVIIPGIILMSASFVCLAAASGKVPFMIAAVLFGAGYGTVQPTLNGIIISKCRPERRGAANATFLMAMDLGLGIGAIIWGIVSGSYSYAAVYWSGLVIFVISLLYAAALNKKTEG